MADLTDLPLLDHHCHGLVADDLDRARFERLASESGMPAPAGATVFDSQVGVVIRAECAPLLGLPRHASADDYLRRRRELGAEEVHRRLLRATGITRYFLETGFRAGEILGPGGMAAASGQHVDEVVRLEAVAERVAEGGTTAGGFAAAFAAALAEAAADAVATKSIVAYRFGLDFDPARPTPREVTAAAGEWLRDCERRGTVRLDHPVLLRHLLWAAVELGRPIQFHTGFGDADLTLHRVNPSLMTGFIRAVQPTGVQLLLLHTYPFQREAGYLAHVWPHVWLDTGLAVGYTGLRSPAVLRESLELAPFHKVLFSTDAFGLAELYACGALLWRRGMAAVLDEWVAADWLSAADAERYARMIAYDNAVRAYGLQGSD